MVVVPQLQAAPHTRLRLPASRAPTAVTDRIPSLHDALDEPPLPSPSLAHLLRAQAARIGDRDLLRFGDDRLTFAEVDIRSDQVASVLRELDVAPGTRVAVMLPNGFDFPVIWLGIAKCGAVMVPLNVQYRARDLRYTLADSGASVLFVDPAFADVVDAVAGECPALRTIVPVERGAMRADSAGPFSDRLREAHAPVALDAIDAGALLNIQYTSGTTGDPKGCMLTQEYWLRLAMRAATFSHLTADDVVLTAQPFYYMDPQWNVAMCVLVGAPLVILPRFSASTFWSTVKSTGTTFFYVLGTMPVFLLKQPEDPAVERTHRVRFVACSGIVPQLHAAFEARWGVPWREVFGMTETGADLVVPVEDHACVGTGSVGRPVPGKAVRIKAADGSAAATDTIGELCIRGSGMMLGYWNRPEATAERIRDGWLHTGDLATQDAAGRIRIVGRLKDMIRRTGENISAAEVEGVLCEHPSVRAAAVVPVPDELRGEEVKAFVQLQPGHEHVEPQELVAFAQVRLAAFKVPRFIAYVTDFPRTPSERIAKHVLLAECADPRQGAFDATVNAWR